MNMNSRNVTYSTIGDYQQGCFSRPNLRNIICSIIYMFSISV